MGGGGAAVAAEEPVKDRSGTSRMNDLGLFSDLNYTTINDRYDDIGLRRMLNSRLGARAPPAGRRRAAPPRSSQPPLRLCRCAPQRLQSSAAATPRTPGSGWLTPGRCGVRRRAAGAREVQAAHPEGGAAPPRHAAVEAERELEGVFVPQARHDVEELLLRDDGLEVRPVLAQGGQGVGVPPDDRVQGALWQLQAVSPPPPSAAAAGSELRPDTS